MYLSDHIQTVARKKSENFLKTSAIPGGHNGPHHDSETAVRNTAHWLVTFCKVLENYKNLVIEEAGYQAINYLTSSIVRPMKSSFLCRTNPEKDFCNGLMGQAWAMEGLIVAGRILGRSDALALAQEVFFLHPWIENRAVWRRVAVDGSYLTPDGTFNHQLWFAAIASQLSDNEATRRSRLFLDNIGQHVQLYSDGVIFHMARLGTLASIHKLNSSEIAKALLGEGKRIGSRRALKSKSVGYHGFNLYAFALLKQSFPDHSFWTSPKFAKMLVVTQSASFLKSLDQSAYGWPYNPPGIEFAFAGEVFGLGHDYCQRWINRQYDHTYNPSTGDLLTRNVPDPATSAARIYEATRLTGEYTLSRE